MKRILAAFAVLLLIAVIGTLAWGYAPDRDPDEMRAKYANAASRFIDLGGGLSVHVRDEGKADGPALVLLHGSNASLHTWDPWVERLGRTYRIVRYDQIGHGLTGPAPDGRYDNRAFVEVLDRLMVKLGIDSFALAGNSMGGGIAWDYALAHPEKLTALVLVDASGAPEAKPNALPIGFRIAQTPGINRIAQVITPRSMVEKSLRQSVSRKEIIDQAMIDRYWELLLYPGNREATLRRFAIPRTAADPQKLATLRMPTLILWGEEDALIPVSGGTWLAKAIPGSRLIVYPGIGHIPMEELPDRSAADVDAFLKQRGPASGATG